MQACSRPIAHVAAELAVGPRLVQTCLETVAYARLTKQGRTLEVQASLPTPRFLGIDDFARRKGQCYATILCDLEARHVLDVVLGRTQAQVCPLLERLDAPERVEAVSMDMSGAFREAVQLCLPRARIVADHFHVVQHVGKSLAQVLSRCARSQEGRVTLKGQAALRLGAASAALSRLQCGGAAALVGGCRARSAGIEMPALRARQFLWAPGFRLAKRFAGILPALQARRS